MNIKTKITIWDTPVRLVLSGLRGSTFVDIKEFNGIKMMATR